MAAPTALRKIIGKRPWKVWKGIGSFLLFEFGRKRRNPEGHTGGEYMLWIYMASWRLKKGKKEIAHSESSDRLIKKGAALLTGKRVAAVALSSTIEKSGDHYSARFWFEGGYSVEASMYDDYEPSSIFMFYTPTTVVHYNYDGTLTENSPNQPPRMPVSGTPAAGAPVAPPPGPAGR
jgi:hypothetical protein